MFSSVVSGGAIGKSRGQSLFVGFEDGGDGNGEEFDTEVAGERLGIGFAASEEYGPGMETPRTLEVPRASTAMAATTAESMPPLRPTMALENLHLRT